MDVIFLVVLIPGMVAVEEEVQALTVNGYLINHLGYALEGVTVVATYSSNSKQTTTSNSGWYSITFSSTLSYITLTVTASSDSSPIWREISPSKNSNR